MTELPPRFGTAYELAAAPQDLQVTGRRTEVPYVPGLELDITAEVGGILVRTQAALSAHPEGSWDAFGATTAPPQPHELRSSPDDGRSSAERALARIQELDRQRQTKAVDAELEQLERETNAIVVQADRDSLRLFANIADLPLFTRALVALTQQPSEEPRPSTIRASVSLADAQTARARAEADTAELPLAASPQTESIAPITPGELHEMIPGLTVGDVIAIDSVPLSEDLLSYRHAAADIRALRGLIEDYRLLGLNRAAFTTEQFQTEFAGLVDRIQVIANQVRNHTERINAAAVAGVVPEDFIDPHTEPLQPGPTNREDQHRAGAADMTTETLRSILKALKDL